MTYTKSRHGIGGAVEILKKWTRHKGANHFNHFFGLNWERARRAKKVIYSIMKTFLTRCVEKHKTDHIVGEWRPQPAPTQSMKKIETEKREREGL